MTEQDENTEMQTLIVGEDEEEVVSEKFSNVQEEEVPGDPSIPPPVIEKVVEKKPEKVFYDPFKDEKVPKVMPEIVHSQELNKSVNSEIGLLA